MKQCAGDLKATQGCRSERFLVLNAALGETGEDAGCALSEPRVHDRQSEAETPLYARAYSANRNETEQLVLIPIYNR